MAGEHYRNTPEQVRRPHLDVVLMVQLFVLQSLYGLSDPEPERQADDKIAFLIFSGFPVKVLDLTTISDFKKYLSKTKKDKTIWNEHLRQPEGKG